jgi:hypothetical protein
MTGESVKRALRTKGRAAIDKRGEGKAPVEGLRDTIQGPSFYQSEAGGQAT